MTPVSNLWHVARRQDSFVRELADRHYSRKTPGAAEFCGPGRVCILKRPDAAWVTQWMRPEYTEHAWPGAWMCSIFRNEGPVLSSRLIRHAVAATRWTWPETPESGMITFVDARKVRKKRDPGRCFRKAGFRHVGFSKVHKLWAFQLVPEDMPEPLPPRGAQMRLDFGP